jgi:hypothetical protein
MRGAEHFEPALAAGRITIVIVAGRIDSLDDRRLRHDQAGPEAM